MSYPVHLRLYASVCARNDFYLDRIRDTADALELDYTLEKVLDEDVIEAAGLQVSCLFAYCPGCRALHAEITADDPTARCTPALEADGQLLFWDVPANDAALRAALAQYA